MNRDEILEFVKDNFFKLSIHEIANHCNKSEVVIRRMANQELHLTKRITDYIKKKNEVFVELPNFSKYQISNYGTFIKKSNKTMIQHTFSRDGYHLIKLVNDQGKRVSNRVHRLVAETFIPIPADLDSPVVNHIDGNKDNNSIFNLEWVSQSKNLIHAYRNNLKIP